MKKTLGVLLFAICATISHAQDIEPGVYRYAGDMNAVKITVEGDIVKTTAWKSVLDYIKSGPGVYVCEAYKMSLEVVSKDKILVKSEQASGDLLMYAPADNSHADGLIAFDWNGDRYYAKEADAEEKKHLLGEYLYTGREEPKAGLSEGNAGYFQRHDVPPLAFEWWGIETNYKGEVQKITGENGSYKMILVAKYAEGNRFVEKGSFDRMQIVVSPSERKTRIMGERILNW